MVTFEPPEIVIAGLTTIVTTRVAFEPFESVTVSVSKYVPAGVLLAAVMAPVTELTVMPVRVSGEIVNTFVPVPPVTENPEAVAGIVTVVDIAGIG